MRTMSLWASENVIASRLLLVLLHTSVILIALYSGVLLAIWEFALPIWIIPITIFLIGISFLVYPYNLKSNFKFRKTLDFGFVLMYFVLLLSWGSQTPIINSQEARALTIAEERVLKTDRVFTGLERVLSAPHNWLKKRMQVRADQWSKLLQEPSLTTVVFLFIIILFTVAFLGYAVAGIACNLSCSGYEAAAAIVLILGWGGLLVGAFFAGRAVIRRWGRKRNRDDA